MLQRAVVSAMYAIGVAAATVGAAMTDGSVSGAEWTAILIAIAIAFMGKLSDNTRVFSIYRKGMTALERRAFRRW